MRLHLFVESHVDLSGGGDFLSWSEGTVNGFHSAGPTVQAIFRVNDVVRSHGSVDQGSAH